MKIIKISAILLAAYASSIYGAEGDQAELNQAELNDFLFCKNTYSSLRKNNGYNFFTGPYRYTNNTFTAEEYEILTNPKSHESDVPNHQKFNDLLETKKKLIAKSSFRFKTPSRQAAYMALKALAEDKSPATTIEKTTYFFNNFGLPSLGLAGIYCARNLLPREITIAAATFLGTSFAVHQIPNLFKNMLPCEHPPKLSDAFKPTKRTIFAGLAAVGAFAATRFFG